LLRARDEISCEFCELSWLLIESVSAEDCEKTFSIIKKLISQTRIINFTN